MGRVRFDSGSFQEDSKAGSVEEYEMRADLTTEIKKTCINRSEKLRHKKAILGLLFLLFNQKQARDPN